MPRRSKRFLSYLRFDPRLHALAAGAQLPRKRSKGRRMAMVTIDHGVLVVDDTGHGTHIPDREENGSGGGTAA